MALKEQYTGFRYRSIDRFDFKIVHMYALFGGAFKSYKTLIFFSNESG